MLICGFHGCHVVDTQTTRECDCTKCSSTTPLCAHECNSFMAKARHSIFFSKAAKEKCDMCLEFSIKEFKHD